MTYDIEHGHRSYNHDALECRRQDLIDTHVIHTVQIVSTTSKYI